MNKPTLNDAAWEKLFDKYDILKRIENDGFFNISASQIREFREPRLMTKFDHVVNLPELFAGNRLSILPVTRGDYIISSFDAYHKFETADMPVHSMSLPDYVQSLNSDNISSETIALNCAAASGIIEDFTEDENIFATVSGRMGSGEFSFNIRDVKNNEYRKIDVKNSQIEIDAAYEGVSSLVLFEAKKEISEDFLVRQLYYPFRVWKKHVNKPVKTVFLVYSNGVFRLFEYCFEQPDSYNSLRLVKQKNYSVEDTTISVADIQSILKTSTIVEEPEIPFPQADKFERIINLCELLNTQKLSRSEVTEKYAFDARQTNYYTDAARYLGLLERQKENGNALYSISRLGGNILKMNFKQRQLAYCKAVLSHKVFNDMLNIYFKRGAMPSVKETVRIMKESRLCGIESDSTYKRRSSSVKSWINWIVSLINV
ncbi:MAG: hypothetical protein IIY20_03175 [Bifidobacteriaceae bacterium]|nr:hypothetical protein [Bifidobacteriaceae bacterium]